MGIIGTLHEVIDMRSFSNLWYWIALAVTWSRASHNVVGVPWDMVSQARRHRGQAEADLITILRIRLNRMIYIHRTVGVMSVAVVSAVLSALAIAGFVYGMQFAQAVFLIAAPMAVVGVLRLRAALAIDRDWPVAPAPLYARLRRHRLAVQLIAIASIMVTAIWGMLQNLSLSVL